MTVINQQSLINFLQSYLDISISNVTFLGTGMFSQAFSFKFGQKKYVIRLNTHEEDFLKDTFAYQRFTSDELPIPTVIRCGRFDENYYFAITEYCAGATLNELNEASIWKILPSLFETLYQIHTLDVSKYSGWGLTNAFGHGNFASWSEYLLSFYNQKFAFTWEHLFSHTFMERDLYQTIFDIIQNYLPVCSTDKCWVHGDFGFDNVMSDGQKITGVLDWAESRLGDFVYDIAYLEFWSEEICYKQLWQEWSIGKELNLCLSNFEERTQLYTLHIGLGGLAIAAIQNDVKDYTKIKERIYKIINAG